MRINKKIINTRRNKILSEIQTHNEVWVNELSKQLNVSPLTIRRDLQFLEEDGFVERFYGGARFKENKNTDNNEIYEDNIIHSLAKCAANYIEDNDTIFINSSKTALYVIQYINSKNVTVITNNCKIFLLKSNPNVSIFATGGEFNPIKKSFTGEFALRNLNKVSATKCFLGCSGINSNGITTVVPQEVAINECMLERCIGDVFIIADSSKIGREYSFLSGSIKKINTLITNAPISEELINIQKRGVKVVQINT